MRPGTEPGERGFAVGRDPRDMSAEELRAAGHKPMSPLKALRLHCVDCCGGSANEVRLCVAVKCPSWPFRTGANPWRAAATDAQREASRANLARARAAPEGPKRQGTERGNDDGGA